MHMNIQVEINDLEFFFKNINLEKYLCLELVKIKNTTYFDYTGKCTSEELKREEILNILELRKNVSLQNKLTDFTNKIVYLEYDALIEECEHSIRGFSTKINFNDYELIVFTYDQDRNLSLDLYRKEIELVGDDTNIYFFEGRLNGYNEYVLCNFVDSIVDEDKIENSGFALPMTYAENLIQLNFNKCVYSIAKASKAKILELIEDDSQIKFILAGMLEEKYEI